MADIERIMKKLEKSTIPANKLSELWKLLEGIRKTQYDVVHSKASSTIEHLIEDDREEIEDLFELFEKEEEYEEDVAELKTTVDDFIENLIQNNDTNLQGIEQIVEKLGKSKILKSKLLRLTMILKDMQRNRQRVANVLNQMGLILSSRKVEEKYIKNGLQTLLIDGSINQEQHEELIEMVAELDLMKLLEVVGKTKIGRGIQFLPRSKEDLLKKLHKMACHHQKNPSRNLKKKMKASLDELLSRKAITKGQYNNIKQDI